jgi:hypothetical protein
MFQIETVDFNEDYILFGYPSFGKIQAEFHIKQSSYSISFFSTFLLYTLISNLNGSRPPVPESNTRNRRGTDNSTSLFFFWILCCERLNIHTHNVLHDLRGFIQQFPNWPPGARTANDTALCHIAISWVSLVSFAAITLYVASQRVFVVLVYFIIDSVRKLLDTPLYMIDLTFHGEDESRCLLGCTTVNWCGVTTCTSIIKYVPILEMQFQTCF